MKQIQLNRWDTLRMSKICKTESFSFGLNSRIAGHVYSRLITILRNAIWDKLGGTVAPLQVTWFEFRGPQKWRQWRINCLFNTAYKCPGDMEFQRRSSGNVNLETSFTSWSILVYFLIYTEWEAYGRLPHVRVYNQITLPQLKRFSHL
jgi:hypothetical protein